MDRAAYHTAHEDFNGAGGVVSTGLALPSGVVDKSQRHTQLILACSLQCISEAVTSNVKCATSASGSLEAPDVISECCRRTLQNAVLPAASSDQCSRC